VNLDPSSTLRLHRGDRVAQLVVQPVVRARFVPVTELPASDRGAAGHGSTGGAAALGRPAAAHPTAPPEGRV
jgi:dUTP pyrophosphatase